MDTGTPGSRGHQAAPGARAGPPVEDLAVLETPDVRGPAGIIVELAEQTG